VRGGRVVEFLDEARVHVQGGDYANVVSVDR
jgi:hypothetical protein